MVAVFAMSARLRGIVDQRKGKAHVLGDARILSGAGDCIRVRTEQGFKINTHRFGPGLVLE